MTQLQRTSHQTYCPYKGECAYYSIPAGGERSVDAVWTYEAPYAAVSAIRDHLAFIRTGSTPSKSASKAEQGVVLPRGQATR